MRLPLPIADTHTTNTEINNQSLIRKIIKLNQEKNRKMKAKRKDSSNAKQKNRAPEKEKNSFGNVEINERDFCFGDRLFWKITIVHERFFILRISIGLLRLKDMRDFHIIAPKRLR